MLWKFDRYIESLLLESDNFLGIIGFTNTEGEIAYAPVYDTSTLGNNVGAFKSHGRYLNDNNKGNPRALLFNTGASWRYATKSKTLYYWLVALKGDLLYMLLDISEAYLKKKGYEVLHRKVIHSDGETFAKSHDFV